MKQLNLSRITLIAMAMFMFVSFNGRANQIAQTQNNQNKIIPLIMMNDNTLDKPIISEAEDDFVIILTLKIHVRWGRKSRGCKGFGLCIFTTFDPSIQTERLNYYAGSTDDGHLVLMIKDKGLKEIKNYFGGNTIIIEEDFVLPDEVTKKLKLKKGYTIKKGRYQVNVVNKGKQQIANMPKDAKALTVF